MSYDFCPTCGDDQYYEQADRDDDVVVCFSCRLPLRKKWLDLELWTAHDDPRPGDES